MTSATDTVDKDGSKNETRRNGSAIKWDNTDAIDSLTSSQCMRTEREKLRDSVKSSIPKSDDEQDILLK